MRKFTINLDALVVISVLFATSLIANVVLVKVNNRTGQKWVDSQYELLLSQLTMASIRDELSKCEHE